jgi:hypothetical protein
MADLIQKLKRLAGLARESEVYSKTESSGNLPEVSEVLSEEVVIKLMHMIENTHEREYTCEETFAVLDEFVELAVDKKDAAVLMPLVKRHIDLCVDCRDQYETLLRILQTDSSSPSG